MKTDTHSKNPTPGGHDMTTTESTTPEAVAPEMQHMATIQEIANIGMPATSRCARCGAQAYVEVEIVDKGEAHLEYGVTAERPGTPEKVRRMEFCAHHFNENETGLVLQAKRIIDHRPFLAHQENLYKGGVPVK